MVPFKGEQAQITKVEQDAGQIDKETSEKKHERLEAELKSKHDVFFSQVDATNGAFKKADQLKDPKAIASIGKDKAEIKQLLLAVASSGEGIIASKEANVSFATIRQSAQRLSTLTKTIDGNVQFFTNMGNANLEYDKSTKPMEETYKIADSLKKIKPKNVNADSFKKNNLKKEKEFLRKITETIMPLGGAMGLISSPGSAPSSPELSAIHENIKAKIVSRMDAVTDLRLKYLTEWENDTDEKKEAMSPEKKQLIAIREGEGGPGGKYGVGYNGLKSLIETAKHSVKYNTPEAQKECSTAKETADKLLAALNGINGDKLTEEYAVILYSMKSAVQMNSKEINALIGKLEKGHEEVDGNQVINSVEKEYREGPDSGLKAYERTIEVKNLVMPGIVTAKEDELNDLNALTEKGLNKLCASKGKLMAIDRANLPREQIMKFKSLNGEINTKIQQLASIKTMLANKRLIDNINAKKTYLKIVKKNINGMEVVVIEETDEFKKLSPDKQKMVRDQFTAVKATIALELTMKLNLKEDKDWNDGLAQMNSGNWQGAKPLLLRYQNKFQNNPDKAMQVSAAVGVLQQIVKMEFHEAAARHETMTGVMMSDEWGEMEHDGGSMDRNVGKIQLMEVRKYLDKVKDIVDSGKYLTIEEVWAKAGALKIHDIKASGISFLNPSEQQALLSEPDPVKRKANILMLARAAQKAGMTRFAKKYFDMYFAKEIAKEKKTISRKSIAKAFDEKDGDKIVKQAVIDAKESAKRKHIRELNRRYPDDPRLGSTDANIAKWEATYDAKSGGIAKRVRDGIIDDAYSTKAKQSIHGEWAGKTVEGNAGNIWNEAYGGTFGVAEDIDDSFFVFTHSELAHKAAQLVETLVYLELAIAAGVVTGGYASAAVMGGGAGVTAWSTPWLVAKGTGLAVEGLVMHSTSVALHEGRAGFQDSKAFLKGLGMTYATLGVLKGMGHGLEYLGGKVGAEGVAEGVAEGAAKSFYTPFGKSALNLAGKAAKGGMKLAAKSTLDSAVLTGLSYGYERLFEGNTMSGKEVMAAFGDNMVTFMVMGAYHSLGPKEAGAGKKRRSKQAEAELKGVKEAHRLRRAADAAVLKAVGAKNAKPGSLRAKMLKGQARRAKARAANAEANLPKLEKATNKQSARELAANKANMRAVEKRAAADADPGSAVKMLEAQHAEASAQVLRAQASGSKKLPAEIAKARKLKKDLAARKTLEKGILEKDPRVKAAKENVKQALKALEGLPEAEQKAWKKEIYAREAELKAIETRSIAEEAHVNKSKYAKGLEISAKQAEAVSVVAKKYVKRSKYAEKQLKGMEAKAVAAERAGNKGKAEDIRALAELARVNEIFESFDKPADQKKFLKYLKKSTSKTHCDALETGFKKGAKMTVAEIGDARDAAAKFIAKEKRNTTDPKKLAELQKLENLMYKLDPAKLKNLKGTELGKHMERVQGGLKEYSDSLGVLRDLMNPKLEAKLRENHTWGKEGRPTFDKPLIGKDGKINVKAQAKFDAELMKAIERTGITVEDRVIFNSIKGEIIKGLQAKVGKNMSPKAAHELVMHSTEALLYQMKLSNQRQLGEHGARHIGGNIVKTMENYAAATTKLNPDGTYKIPIEGKPGKFRSGTLQDAVKALSPEARLMATLSNVYHDIGYSSASAHSSVSTTGTHPVLSRVMIENNAALRELFEGKNPTAKTRGNFEAFLEMMNSHDKIRTSADGAEIIMPNGSRIKIGLIGKALQLADNAAIATGEKLPPVLRDSLKIRDTMRDAGLAYEGFIADGKLFTPAEIARLRGLSGDKVQLTLGTTKYEAIDTGLKKSRDIEKSLSAGQKRVLREIRETATDPVDLQKRIEGAIDGFNADKIFGKELSAEQTVLLKKYAALSPKQVEAIGRMKAVSERWNKGLKDAKAEIEASNLNPAQKRNALEAIKDVGRNFDKPWKGNTKFLNAASSMDLLVMGDTVRLLDGSEMHTFSLRAGFEMDVNMYKDGTLLSAQIKKMPGDYAEGKIKDKLNSTKKTFDTMTAVEKTTFLESMGLTKAEYDAARAKDPAKWDKKMKSNKDAAELLKDIYIEKQGVDAWLKNPAEPLRIKLDPFSKPGDPGLSIVIEGSKVPPRNSREYKAASYMEGGVRKNLYKPGETPKTPQGYKSLHRSMHRELTMLKAEQWKGGMKTGEALKHAQRITSIEATIASVEAKYTSFRANEALSSPTSRGKNAMHYADRLGKPLEYHTARANIRAVATHLSMSGSTPVIRAQATEVITLMRRVHSANDTANIGKLRDAVKTLSSMQTGSSQVTARAELREAS